MGTSNSYGGPGPNKPLLPPWADEPIQPFPLPDGQIPPRDGSQPQDQPEPVDGPTEPQDSPDTQPTPTIRPYQALGSARSSISRYASTGGRGHLSSGIRSHTASLGGAKGATQSARSGRSATQKLGGYLSNISSRGITAASEDLGISNILGKPVNVAISQIIDKLVPDSSALENAVARRAIVKTLEEIYYKYGIEEQGLEVLNGVDEEAIEEAILSSTVNYVFERFLLDLADRIENKDISEGEAISLEKEMKEYIKFEVKRRAYDDKNFKGVNWFGKQGKDITESIYQQVYEILEATK